MDFLRTKNKTDENARMDLDGSQESVEISLTFSDSRKSGMCGPWISSELGIIQIYLLDRMSGLIGREIICLEMVKNTVFPPPLVFYQVLRLLFFSGVI